MKKVSQIPEWAAQQSSRILYDIVTHIPSSSLKPVVNPQLASEEIVRKACFFSATTSASLSMPGGLLALATIFPDLATLWRIQAQMVADIAALHGRTEQLTREAMIWCLFKHTTSQVAADFAVRLGERILLQQLSQQALQSILQKLGVQGLKMLTRKSATRILPLAGSAVAGAYTWHNTKKVGRTAQEYFSNYEPEDSH